MPLFTNSRAEPFFRSLLAASTAPALAQGCKAYPYTDGMEIDGSKYVATASASVSFDDIDAVKDAREEATMEAKAALAKFMTQGIQSDSIIAKLVNESKTMSGVGKENVRKEATQRTKLLRNSSRALLRGVIIIGDCYTKGTEVRVTVGVKPETINAAEGLAGKIGSSVANQPTPGAQNQSNASGGLDSNSSQSAKQPLTNVDEYSNTKNIRKF
jgi:hypothetical protein